jgi:type 1 glutamine amidotransferase
MKSTRLLLVLALFLLACTPARLAAKGARPRPLRVLWVAGGVWHDFDALVPLLTSSLSQRMDVSFDVHLDLEVWRDEHFADAYDAVVYQFCIDDAEGVLIDQALQVTRAGKPTVLLHAAVHSFRDSERVGEWEIFCGMRSKVHDPYQSFQTTKLAHEHPVTLAWPESWTTPGDELYQTSEFLPGSRPLLAATSPQDGREHIVSWTSTYGRGRIFATTLGHDLETARLPEYQRLLADGPRWVCGRPGDEGPVPDLETRGE